MMNYNLEGTLTLFYYNKLDQAFNFYKNVLKLDFVADFGYVKIFKI